MQSAAGVAGPLTNINKRIRFSQTITFETSGTVHVSQDVETPERVKELETTVIHGLDPVALVAPARRGGWPKGKKRVIGPNKGQYRVVRAAKKSKSRR